MSQARDLASLVKFVTDDYKVSSDYIDSDTLSATANKSLATSTGTKGYSSPDQLPAGAPAGSQAFVSSNNRLYVSNGSGWYHVAVVNQAPYWITQPDGSYTLSTTGVATTITILGGDSDGHDVPQYTATGDSGFNAIATVTKDSDNGRTFIITPIDSESSASPTGGSGVLTFTLSDGKQSVLSNSTFSILFGTVQDLKMTASDKQVLDQLGSAVDIDRSGYRVVASAYHEDTGANYAGALYVFNVDSRSGNITEEAKLQASDRAELDQLGRYAVGIDSTGTRVVAGSFWHDAGATEAGAAYIFVRSGTTWTQEAKLQASDLAQYDAFGYSLSINYDGNYVAVGTQYGGGLYVFNRSGSTWTEQQILPDERNGQYNGITSVSLDDDGDYLLAGYGNSGGFPGQAVVFKRSGSTWATQATLTASDGQTADRFGKAVSINYDGAWAIVGAPGEDGGSGDPISNAGAVYIFERVNTSWYFRRKITSPNPAVNGNFGSSVKYNTTTAAVSNRVVIGEPGTNSCYVFNASNGTKIERLIGSDIGSGDNFGAAVACDYNARTIVTGAPQEDGGSGDPISNAGAVYLHRIS